MLIFLPICALLFLAWAPLPSKPPRLLWLVLPALAAGSLLVVVNDLIPDRWKYPEAQSMGITEYAIDQFRAASRPGKPIILLEGSSLTFYGVNGPLLQMLLEAKGLPVTVLQFSSPGANHYERQKMFSEFLKALSDEERQGLENSQVLLLREVLSDYDKNPLTFLETDSLGRNVPYTSAAVFPKIWRTGSHRPDAGSFHWNLIKCTLLHEFGVGTLSASKIPSPPAKLKPYAGLGVKNEDHSFDFSESWKEFAESYVRGGKIGESSGIAPQPAWSEATEDLYELLGRYVDRTGYFSPPVLSSAEFHYQSEFLRSLPSDQVALGPLPPDIYQELNKREMWYDPRHTTVHGIIIFTRWLADEIDAKRERLFLEH